MPGSQTLKNMFETVENRAVRSVEYHKFFIAALEIEHFRIQNAKQQLKIPKRPYDNLRSPIRPEYLVKKSICHHM